MVVMGAPDPNLGATSWAEISRALSRGGLVEITTAGRRTGLRRRIPIALHAIEGRLYISGMPRPRRRSWLANLEADPRLILHLVRGPRADLAATARIISDEAERRSILRHVAEAWGRRDLETMVRFSPLIEVIIDGPSN